MKQTAVEWFNEEINKLNVGTDARVFIAKLFELAKEMEKEQMIKFYKWMLENNTEQNAEKYFHFTDSDMLNEYYKQD